MPVRWEVLRERERTRAPVLDYSEPSRAERSRPDVKESWLLFEGIDTFLYDIMRKSKIENRNRDIGTLP